MRVNGFSMLDSAVRPENLGSNLSRLDLTFEFLEKFPNGLETGSVGEFKILEQCDSGGLRRGVVPPNNSFSVLSRFRGPNLSCFEILRLYVLSGLQYSRGQAQSVFYQ